MSETQCTHYEAMGAALQRAAVMYTDGEPLERIAYYIETARMQCEKAKEEHSGP